MYWTENANPFDELHSLQREMNRLFNGYDERTTLSRFPALNIWGDQEKMVVTAELPGMEPENIDIQVVENQLTLKGERPSDEPAEDAVCHRCERDAGTFTRTIRLPFAIESDKVTATYTNGILTLTLPRLEASKPKQIEINVG